MNFQKKNSPGLFQGGLQAVLILMYAAIPSGAFCQCQFRCGVHNTVNCGTVVKYAEAVDALSWALAHVVAFVLA